MKLFCEIGFYGYVVIMFLHFMIQNFLAHKYPEIAAFQKEAYSNPDVLEVSRQIIHNGPIFVQPWFFLSMNFVVMILLICMGIKAQVTVLAWVAFMAAAMYMYISLWNRVKYLWA